MDRESDNRHIGIWIVLFAVAVVLAYPLSVGPAMWMVWNTDSPEWFVTGVELVYAPLEMVLDCGPDWLVDAYEAYLELWGVYGIHA